MPRGIPNKKISPIQEKEVKAEVVINAKETEKEIEKVVLKKEVVETPNPVVEKLPVGQKYFEAPDGTLIVGDADKQQVWYRKLNNGQGGWINPKR